MPPALASRTGTRSTPRATIPTATLTAGRTRPLPKPSLRVLIVEDDADSRDALMELCRRAGHTCLASSTQAEALAMLVHRAPDVILLDLMLPGGNGAEVLRVVRDHNLPTRVALVTAADSTMIDEVQRLKPDAVFRKPLDFVKVGAWLTDG